MTTSPFDEEDQTFYALVNEEGQYSLWPVFVSVPDGWAIVCEGLRQVCLDYIEQNWTDMRPRRLTADTVSSATGCGGGASGRK